MSLFDALLAQAEEQARTHATAAYLEAVKKAVADSKAAAVRIATDLNNDRVNLHTMGLSLAEDKQAIDAAVAAINTKKQQLAKWLAMPDVAESFAQAEDEVIRMCFDYSSTGAKPGRSQVHDAEMARINEIAAPKQVYRYFVNKQGQVVCDWHMQDTLPEVREAAAKAQKYLHDAYQTERRANKKAELKAYYAQVNAEIEAKAQDMLDSVQRVHDEIITTQRTQFINNVLAAIGPGTLVLGKQAEQAHAFSARMQAAKAAKKQAPLLLMAQSDVVKAYEDAWLTEEKRFENIMQHVTLVNAQEAKVHKDMMDERKVMARALWKLHEAQNTKQVAAWETTLLNMGYPGPLLAPLAERMYAKFTKTVVVKHEVKATTPAPRFETMADLDTHVKTAQTQVAAVFEEAEDDTGFVFMSAAALNRAKKNEQRAQAREMRKGNRHAR